jgi:2-C-methyl-D-erythritol 2,4-cyclodiphosphate synthase
MIRVGHGYDAHRLIENRDLILCGVKLKHDKGLLGHSDADVAIHAIIDSLLGAAGLGDIGQHFPDTDASFKDINSMILLERTKEILNASGFSIGNIDCTIIAEKPKINSYIDGMRNKISECLEIEIRQINIKATTEEGLGFTGNQEGIAAHAVALIFTSDEK